MKLLVQVCLILTMLIGCDSKKKNSESKKNVPVQTNERKEFDYQPRKPENGTLYAAVELGALGLNYFIANIDKQNRWSLSKAKYGRSNIIYGVSTTDDIIKNVIAFRKEILTAGVKKDNIHVLVSSSALKANIVKELEEKLLSYGLKLKYISSEDEAKYALKATIPKEFVRESFMVDIGSGNTKLSWVQNDDTLSIEIHGSKYFLGDVPDTTVFREVRDALLEIPKENRVLCFMLGGMIYEFVKDELTQSKDKRYFILQPPGSYPSDNQKLRAGNVIYNALYLDPTYSYIFDSESNFSIGYLLSLNK